MNSGKTKLEKQEKLQEEALNIIWPHFKCSVDMSVGSGKTYLGLKHMLKLYEADNTRKFLVVHPVKSIKDSWSEAISVLKLDYLLDSITFVTYRSLLKSSYDYHCVYFDECHSLKASHEPFLILFKGKTLGLSGTMPEIGVRANLIAKYMPTVYKYTTDDGVNDDMLNDYKIIVHMLRLDERKNLPVKGKSWYTSELNSYNYWTSRLVAAEESGNAKSLQICRVMRMKEMQNFLSKEDYVKELLNIMPPSSKTIIFTNYKDQADRLCEHSYHSSNTNSNTNLESFKKGDITRLSAVLQLNEGANIPKLESGIILHAYGNNVKSQQRIGRLMRLNPNQTATVHILCYTGTVDEK